MENFSGPIGLKYAEIDLAGKNSLNKAEIKRFEGLDESLKNRFISALQFSPESEKEVERRITSEMAKIAVEFGISFTLAGKDFPLHSTIGEGLYEGKDDSEREEIFDQTHGDKKLDDILSRISKEPIEYKYLLLDKGNVILSAIKIPEEITAARSELASFYQEKGMKPLLMENILHITIGRMNEIPEEGKEESFEGYKKKMIALRHAISSDPIKLQVSGVFDGETYGFLRSMEK